MKTRLTLIVCLFLLGTGSLLGQPVKHMQAGHSHHEKAESMLIGYLTQRLELTPVEAQKFWPLFNELKAERRKLDHEPMIQLRRMVKNPEKWAQLSDKEALTLMENHQSVMEERARLERKYKEKFLTVLSPKKVLLLHVAQEEFKQAMLDRLRERQGQGLP